MKSNTGSSRLIVLSVLPGRRSKSAALCRLYSAKWIGISCHNIAWTPFKKTKSPSPTSKPSPASDSACLEHYKLAAHLLKRGGRVGEVGPGAGMGGLGGGGGEVVSRKVLVVISDLFTEA